MLAWEIAEVCHAAIHKMCTVRQLHCETWHCLTQAEQYEIVEKVKQAIYYPADFVAENASDKMIKAITDVLK
jgi:hypothetical protein